MIRILFSLFLLGLLPAGTLSAEVVIRGVRYLKPNASFSETSDLYIQNGIISRISPSKQKDSIRYVLPSFCDAYVTLGANAIGGVNNLPEIRIALKSFLFHGFTHIQSVADGPWIYQIKSEVDSGKILGPRITISNRPLIPKSPEIEDVSDILYFHADKQDSTLKEFEKQIMGNSKTIHIFNRHNEDEVFSFDSGLLNQMGIEAKSKKKFLTIHTFADRMSILDALISGNRYLVHPILFEMQREIAKQHKEELHLIPILNVYRNLQFNTSKDGAGLLELELLRKKSKFFNDNYSATFETYLNLEIKQEELEIRKFEYASYLQFIGKNPILKEKMILGSGSGNRLSFPGISGIQELRILAKILKFNESFFYIPTQNSCSYLGGSYNGVIAPGSEGNLILLKENPIKNIDTLFQIEQVFQNGKLVQFGEPEKKRSKKK